MEHVPLTDDAVDNLLYPFILNGDEISMALLAKVLKGYSSKEQFEKDWDCKLLSVTGGIVGVVFNSESTKTGFMLKYNK